MGKTLLWNPSPYLTIRALLFNFSLISTVDMTTSNLPLSGEGRGVKGWGLRGENKGFGLLTTSVSLVMVFSLVVMKYPK